MKYVLGLDVGIGSIGWAVVRNEEENKRIEDFGVRIFKSGEDVKNRKRESQKRRGYRGSRRTLRRRKHRKERIKDYCEKIGLITRTEIEEFFQRNTHNIIDIRVKGLDEKLTPQELVASVLHIAKHRGYKPFYDGEDLFDDKGENLKAMNKTIVKIEAGGYRTIAEAIAKDKEHFSEEATGRYKYRNKGESKEILFPSKKYEEELRAILEKQKEYYPQLTNEAVEKINEITFSRRDFEDGPGNVNDEHRPYKGFYETIGNCQFYKSEKRGHRFTVIGDLYALANKLSQYRYVNTETGEVEVLPENLMKSVIEYSMLNGSIGKKEINKLAKEHCISILNAESSKNENIATCFKYIKIVKPIFEEYGFEWEALITEDYLSESSLLNRVGKVMSCNITPSRRIRQLNKIPELAGKEEIILKLSKQSFSGTASVSNKYMKEAIEAFFKGTLVGEYQAQVIESITEIKGANARTKKLPPLGNDNEFAKNPVVFRAINETRKIINAIIQRYGSPTAINLEVASEVNSSFDTRGKLSKKQNENEKNRATAITAIAEIVGIDEGEVTPKQLERYRLGEMQGWKCVYSGEDITDKKEAILNTNKLYEVDHIVPFSLILDNTLNNKVLVLQQENQKKGNRTPLMYLPEDSKNRYKSYVNYLINQKKIGKTKYQYLMLETLRGEEANEILRQWKSRNLNDTRYISKFLVKYLNESLIFEKNEASGYRPDVYAVKGAITSLLRRQWLNKNTWGQKEKSNLKKITYFDHAVDAIVIANCLPEYVIITAENLKLREIYYQAGKKKTEEYNKSLENCVTTLMKYYGMSPKISRKMLGITDSTPSLIEKLRYEVECRVRDYELMRFFIDGAESKTDEELYEYYRQELCKFYAEDQDFAKSIQMPIVSIKPERKYSGQITKDNALSAEKAKDGRYKKKQISENNFSLLDDSCYYCVEVYKTQKGETGLSFIKMTDIVKKHKKLYLRPDYTYPQDYAEHVMYLFQGDYLEITKRKEVRRGYYIAVENANQKMLKLTRGSTVNTLSGLKSTSKELANKKLRNEVCGIVKKDIVKKYEIDILGKKSGEIKKCGEPLSLLPEKD